MLDDHRQDLWMWKRDLKRGMEGKSAIEQCVFSARCCFFSDAYLLKENIKKR